MTEMHQLIHHNDPCDAEGLAQWLVEWHMLYAAICCMQSHSALDAAHSALSALYKDQKEVADPETLQGLPDRLGNDDRYRLAFTSVKGNIKGKSDRSITVDPQRNTISDAYSPDEHRTIMEAMLASGTPESDRTLAMSAWAHGSVGRGDDVRLFYIPDLVAPRALPTVGRYKSQDLHTSLGHQHVL